MISTKKAEVKSLVDQHCDERAVFKARRSGDCLATQKPRYVVLGHVGVSQNIGLKMVVVDLPTCKLLPNKGGMFSMATGDQPWDLIKLTGPLGAKRQP